MSRLRILLPLLLAAVVLLGGEVAAKEEPLERLLGNLLRAETNDAVDRALDSLATRIGDRTEFPNAGAFGDFLGQVAEPKRSHPRVQLRRGWAYIAAGRGREAIGLLEKAERDAPSKPTALAYRGEALRQSGDAARALAVLTEAAGAGYTNAFLPEAALKAAFSLRDPARIRATDGLPPYAEPLAAFLETRPDPVLHASLARWILEDLQAYEIPGSERAGRWAEHAGKQVLKALQLDRGLAGGAQLALDAAVALEAEDRDREGATDRFDLLAWAVRLGAGPDSERHAVPPALAFLAEAALREGRYELAYRMARRRLDVSDSPLARQVLMQLPPDIGD